MNLLIDTDYAPWLVGFALNIGMGLILVIAYNAARSALPADRPWVTSAVIGALFGAAALITMNFPVRTAGGLSIDARNVFILTGSLFGGPVAAVLAGALATVYRIWLGGPGAVGGAASIVVTAAMGTLLARRYGKRVDDLRVHELFLIGLGNAVVITAAVEGALVLQGRSGMPAGAVVSAFVMFPLGAVLLGSAMGMTHHRIWWRTQRRLDDIVGTVSDLVWETDTQGRVTYLSERNKELFGYDPSAFYGKRLTDHNAAWHDAETARLARATIDARHPYSGLLLNVTALDGSVKTMSLNARPVFDLRNRFVGYRGTAQDITRHVQMEEALRESRDVLARAQKIGRVGSGSVDLATGQTVWSDEQYRMLGFDPAKDGASLELYLTRVHPDDRDLLRDTRAANESGEQGRPIEYRIVLPSGETRWVRREVEIERDTAGRPSKLYTTMIDVTESRRLEEELRKSRDSLARAQEVGHIGSCVVDLTTGENVWSDEQYRMLGLDPARGGASLELYLSRIHPDDLALVNEERGREQRGETPKAIEHRVLLPGGETRWVRRESEIECDAAGKPVRLYLTLQDVTEGRRLQEQVRRSADHLERAQRATRIGSAEVDLATGEEFWSDGMFRVCGLDPSKVKGTYAAFLSVIHPDDRAFIENLRATNDRGQETAPVEYRQLRPNGEVRWIRREVEIGLDSSGTPARLIAIHRDVTESRHLEDELRRSEDHLRRAQRTARIGSVEVDLATRKEYWSEGMYAVCGIEPDPTKANLEYFMSCVHPEDRPLLKSAHERNNLGEQTDPVDYRLVRPNGEVRWMRREAEIGLDAAGKPARRISIHQDITERKLAEEELRRSRDANARAVRTMRMLSDCNQLLIQATDEAKLIKDICRTICEVGDYAMAWVGYAQHDAVKSVVPVAIWGAIGQANAEELVNSARISWDENNERGRGPMGRSLRSGQIELERDLESAVNYRPWRASVAAYGIRSTLTIPLKDGGQVFGAIGIYATASDGFDPAERDLLAELGSDLNYGIHALRTRAARDKAERDLSEAQNALRAIMDHTVDGLVTIDEKGKILTFSRPAQTIFGYTAEEVIGQNVKVLVPTPHTDLHDSYVADYLDTGRSKIIGIGREVMGRRKDGTIFPMDLQIGEIPGGPGGHRFVGTLRDITEHKQTEEHLQQARKMEAMGQLTGGVAHDFNNLLAVILGRLQLLDEELVDMPRLQNWAQSCIKAVERGATLTKSLLAFSRQQALVPVELDLNAVVGDMEEMVQRTLGEAFDFRVFKGHGLWRVEADPGQLQNALLNLVLNARDAMPRGGSVVVSTSNTALDADYAGSHRDVRPGEYVLLAVSDTGIGMPREVVERAFEPFYTTKEVGKGSGLGLSMVYGFVKQTGGHVSIYSEPGHGTTVRIYLPRKIDTGAPVASSAPKPDRALTGTETILLVEDNDDLRDLTRLQLERFGYRVLEASHGAEGLRALASNPHVDLLISDVVLPHGMTGPDLADQAVALWPDLKVIFVSGYNEEHDALERTRARRPVRLLQKPFLAEELAALIRSALD